MKNLKINGHAINCDFKLNDLSRVERHREYDDFKRFELLLSNIEGSALCDCFSDNGYVKVSIDEGDDTYTFMGGVVSYEEDSIKGYSATIWPCGGIIHE